MYDCTEVYVSAPVWVWQFEFCRFQITTSSTGSWRKRQKEQVIEWLSAFQDHQSQSKSWNSAWKEAGFMYQGLQERMAGKVTDGMIISISLYSFRPAAALGFQLRAEIFPDSISTRLKAHLLQTPLLLWVVIMFTFNPLTSKSLNWRSWVMSQFCTITPNGPIIRHSAYFKKYWIYSLPG